MEGSDKCAFCLDEIIGADAVLNEEDDDKETPSKTCLRQICHYFKDNLNHKLLIRQLQEDSEGKHTWESPMNTQDFSVMLCQKCTVKVHQLSRLCEELELIQMQVDHSIIELTRLINTPSVENRSVQLVRLARSYTQVRYKGGSQKLLLPELQKARQLKVKLRKCDVKVEKDEVYYDAVAQCSSPSPSLPCLSPQVDNQVEPVPESTGNIKRVVLYKHYCATCSHRFVSKSKKRLHTVMAHPETAFSTIKLDGIPEEHFQSLCRKVLFEATRTLKRDIDENIKCPSCSALYKSKGYLKLHMVDAHYENLCAELTQLQETTGNMGENIGQPSSNILRTMLSSAEDENDAPQVHPSVHELLQNLQEQIVTDEYGESVYNCCFCPDSNVHEVFSDKTSLEKHVFQTHPEYFFFSLKKHMMPEDEFSSICIRALQCYQTTRQIADGGGYCLQSCVVCLCTFLEKGFLIRHQIESHFDLLSEKVLGLQEPTKIKPTSTGRERLYRRAQCPYCQIVFKNQFALGGHLSRSHKVSQGHSKEVKGVYKSKCVHCGTGFTCMSNLNRHLRTSCQFKSGNEQTPSDNPTVETYISPRNPQVGVKKCKYCTAAFSSIFSLSRHMKFKHPNQYLHGVESRNPCGTVRSKCPYCVQDFSNNTNLRRHVTRNHPEKLHEIFPHAQALSCQTCGKSCGDLTEMRRHMKTHSTNSKGNFATIRPAQHRDGTTNEAELLQSGVESEAVLDNLEDRTNFSNYAEVGVKMEYSSTGDMSSAQLFEIPSGMQEENNVYVECEVDETMNFDVNFTENDFVEGEYVDESVPVSDQMVAIQDDPLNF